MAKIIKLKTVFFDEKEVVLLRMTNSSGAYVDVTNYGATITDIVVPDKDGRLDSVVLHYDRLEDYFTDSFYLGCTIGRYANRISKASFTLNGDTFHLDKNDGANSNHGGNAGFNKRVFDYEIGTDSVSFRTKSDDGEGGFPGNLTFLVAYSFSEENELEIIYKALSDKATPVNFTNHTYFNLGRKGDNILQHALKVGAREYLEMDSDFLPTGRVYPIVDTAFDFGEYRHISEMMLLKKDNIEGYNTYFVKDNNLSNNTPMASLKSDISGRAVDVYTSMSGVMVYTADFLSDPFIPFGGICLEAQYHPDGVNHPHFECNILQPNVEKTDSIKYHFRCV